MSVQAQKNALLEERVQVLQQQNEDLKARIDLNLAMSRSLHICTLKIIERRNMFQMIIQTFK